MRTASWTPPQEDSEGTLLNHAVTLAPILPPVLIQNENGCRTSKQQQRQAAMEDDNESQSSTINDNMLKTLRFKYPAVFDDGVPKSCTNGSGPFSWSSSSQVLTMGLSSSTNSSKHQQSQQPPLPTWTPLYTPPVYFDDDYDRETGQLDVANTIPVTRKITALTVRKPHHDYLALGDSAGFVMIYSLGKENINRPIARLESVACQQRAKAEQERVRSDLWKKRSKTANKSNNCSAVKGKSVGISAFSSFNSGPQYASLEAY
jgi:hypothetical protein